MEKRGGEAARGRRTTQPECDPRGWMEDGWMDGWIQGSKEGRKDASSGNLEGDYTTSSG